MRIFKGTIATDIQGSDCAFEFEVEDDATKSEIETEARQAAFDRIEWSYAEVTHNVKVRGCALLRSPSRLTGWAYVARALLTLLRTTCLEATSNFLDVTSWL